jgi:hypothetical protein
VCDEKKCWNAEVSPQSKYQWLKWTSGLSSWETLRCLEVLIRVSREWKQFTFTSLRMQVLSLLFSSYRCCGE